MGEDEKECRFGGLTARGKINRELVFVWNTVDLGPPGGIKGLLDPERYELIVRVLLHDFTSVVRCVCALFLFAKGSVSGHSVCHRKLTFAFTLDRSTCTTYIRSHIFSFRGCRWPPFTLSPSLRRA